MQTVQLISRADRAKPSPLIVSVGVETVNLYKIKLIYCKVISSKLSLDWAPKLLLFSSGGGVLQHQEQGPPFVEGTNKVHIYYSSKGLHPQGLPLPAANFAAVACSLFRLCCAHHVENIRLIFPQTFSRISEQPT